MMIRHASEQSVNTSAASASHVKIQSPHEDTLCELYIPMGQGINYTSPVLTNA